MGNLHLAARARRLFILESGPGDVQRSFFSPEGRTLFEELSRNARVLPYEELIAELGRTRTDRDESGRTLR
jgi:hypothetical protein